jgi:hypothetical protein
MHQASRLYSRRTHLSIFTDTDAPVGDVEATSDVLAASSRVGTASGVGARAVIQAIREEKLVVQCRILFLANKRQTIILMPRERMKTPSWQGVEVPAEMLEGVSRLRSMCERSIHFAHSTQCTEPTSPTNLPKPTSSADPTTYSSSKASKLSSHTTPANPTNLLL